MATIITSDVSGLTIDGLSLVTDEQGSIWCGEFHATLGTGKVSDFVSEALAAGAPLSEIRLFNSVTQELIILPPAECVATII